MGDFDFNIGDKVYYPDISNEILILEKTTNPSHPFKVTLEHGVTRSFTTDGRRLYFNEKPSIFPATQEWYDKLVHVYPDLEKPPKRKTRKEVIQAMLDDGWRGVPCHVSNFDISGSNKRDIIVRLGSTCDYMYRNTDSYGWRFAKPYDPRTGKDIIDYVDGEVVLGD